VAVLLLISKRKNKNVSSEKPKQSRLEDKKNKR